MADDINEIDVPRRRAVVEKRYYQRSRHRDYRRGGRNISYGFFAENNYTLTSQIVFVFVVSVILYAMMSEMQDELDNLNYKITDEQVNNKYNQYIYKWFGPVWWAIVATLGISIISQLFYSAHFDMLSAILMGFYLVVSTAFRNRYSLSLQIRLRKY